MVTYNSNLRHGRLNMSEALRRFVEGRRRKHKKRRRTERKKEDVKNKKNKQHVVQAGEEDAKMWGLLREVQRSTGCTTTTLHQVVGALTGKVPTRKFARRVDRLLANSGGAQVLRRALQRTCVLAKFDRSTLPRVWWCTVRR